MKKQINLHDKAGNRRACLKIARSINSYLDHNESSFKSKFSNMIKKWKTT